jgi:hypothetical protein
MAKATDWAAVTAWAAWATVAVYVVLGIFAWIQVLQARRLREEQARPFVIVDFEPGFLVYLTVENIGRTMARDVTIRFDKPLASTSQGRVRSTSLRCFVSRSRRCHPAGRSACCSTSMPPG